MNYNNEEFKQPVFDELEITFYPTRGVSHVLNDAGVGEIDGVELFHPWSDSIVSTLKFHAPKLTEILTTVRVYAQSDLPEWKRKSVKNSTTRAINALEKCVAKRWEYVHFAYQSEIEQLKRTANGDFLREFEAVLEKAQYGFLVTIKAGGYSTGRGITIAPVPYFIDGEPVIKWCVDDEGFYLSMGGDNRREHGFVYDTLDEAVAEAYCRAVPRIAQNLAEQDEDRQIAIAKLAELEIA